MRKILLFSLVVMIMASSFVFAGDNNIMANVGYRAGTTFSGVDFNVGWVGFLGRWLQLRKSAFWWPLQRPLPVFGVPDA